MKPFRSEKVFIIGTLILIVAGFLYVNVFDGGPIMVTESLYSYDFQSRDFFFPFVLFFADEYMTYFAIFWMFLISVIFLFAYNSGRLKNIKIPRYIMIGTATVSYFLIISLLQYNSEGFPLDFVETCQEQSLNAEPYDPNDPGNWMRELSKCLVIVHDKPYYINMSIFLGILIVWFFISKKLTPTRKLN